MAANDKTAKPNITIRPTKPDDFDQILPLLKQLWPANPINMKAARDIFTKGLALNQRAYLCACHDGRIIGFCTLVVRDCLWLQGDVGYLCDLVVDQEHRGSGIGTALVEKAAEIARQRGCLRVELDSGFHRTAAHQFYENRGFEKRAFLFSRVLK
ncbi:MAG: GNAT family N-acetyltransferase [Planctomycetes bacterium]|nr:GNAT family N-acetyltransferase [Planctomycetota bacterium]